MEDTFSKYLRLFGNILFSFIGFILVLASIFLLLRLGFGWLDGLSWFAYFYMLIILFIPAALFVSVFLIYFKRTVSHPSTIIRTISYVFFSVLLIGWGAALFVDLNSFFKNGSSDIDKYYSYNLLFLVINVASIFLIGIIQALSAEKEKDWMDKYNSQA